jgi:CSLREA domain-containing protein
VSRLIAILAALAAALVIAPAALAATYTVDSAGDAPDVSTADPLCDSDPGAGIACTLRAAIQQANFTPGADTITFTGAGTAPGPLAALDPITGPLTINGGGTTTVTFAGAAAGPLIDVQAGDSTLRAITLTGGASGYVVNLGVAGDRLDTVTVRDTPAGGVRVAGSSVRVDGVRIDAVGGTGVLVTGSSATIASPSITRTVGPGIDVAGSSAAVTGPEVSGSSTDGIRVSGNNVAVSGGHVHGNAGNGLAEGGQNDSVSRVTFYANGGRAIANSPGSNGGISPPAGLRIGPRRADGSLPLTGTSAGGTIELWSGDPSSATTPAFADAFAVSGDFTYNFASEPAPGAVFSASVTAGGSSEFARVEVPPDVVSPAVLGSRALDTQNVRVDASEPLDPASVQKEDFALTMAGKPRTIDSVAVAPDGRFVTLTSSGWKAGEAGIVDVGGPGSLADAAGNASLSGARLRVLAAPGDFVAPLGADLAISPKTICLTRGSKCRKPGMTIKFATTESGKATVVVKRGNAKIGQRIYGNIVAGSNTLKFNGRLGARKLRAGRYRLLMYVQDAVGNVTDQPPIQLFSVRRVTK